MVALLRGLKDLASSDRVTKKSQVIRVPADAVGKLGWFIRSKVNQAQPRLTREGYAPFASSRSCSGVRFTAVFGIRRGIIHGGLKQGGNINKMRMRGD